MDSPAHSLSLFHPTRSYSRYTLAYQDAVPTSSRSIEAEDNDGDAAGNELVNLREINSAWTALHNSFNGANTYDAMQPGEKKRLARDLWSEQSLDDAMRQLRAENSPLAELLQAQMSNTSRSCHGDRTTDRWHPLGCVPRPKQVSHPACVTSDAWLTSPKSMGSRVISCAGAILPAVPEITRKQGLYKDYWISCSAEKKIAYPTLFRFCPALLPSKAQVFLSHTQTQTMLPHL